MNSLLLFRIEFIRSLWEIKRNPFQTLLGILGLGAIFYLILAAGQVVSNNQQTSVGIASLLLNYTLGMIVFFQVSSPSSVIRAESKNGMMEHLYLSQFSLVTIFTARALGNLLINLVQMLILISGLLFLTGTTLEWSVYMILPLLSTVIGALGLGLWYASLAILIKDNSGLFVLSQFALFALVGLPVIKQFWFYLIPIAPSTSLVNWAAFGGKPGWEFLLPALLNSMGYYVIGAWLFHHALRLAKRKGIVGHE
ncbi:MAG: ABC transporter permease [Deinococcales bacterium]